MDRPFIPKCGTVSQVLLQLVVATLSSSCSCTQFLRPPYWCPYTRSRISLASAEAGAKKAERHKKRRLTVVISLRGESVVNGEEKIIMLSCEISSPNMEKIL